VHEGDEPDVLADLCHADALTGEGMTEVHTLATEADAATTTHHDCFDNERDRLVCKP